jgi:hypothetical protein
VIQIPVHVGTKSPNHWEDVEARQQEFGEEASPWLKNQRRPELADAAFPWHDLGFDPCWVGHESVGCAAALEPSIFTGHGANEYERFRQGAAQRNEMALVISVIGFVTAPESRSVLVDYDASVHLSGGGHSSISGRRLGIGATVRLEPGVRGADKDLALRLLNRPSTAPWWALEITGAEMHAGDGVHTYPPEGRLDPILVTEIGEVVVGAWVSPDAAERRYIVPAGTSWQVLLSWLADQALPEYVPGALRRARTPIATATNLLTTHELDAQEELTRLEATYRERHAEISRRITQAHEAADPIRHSLLFGTGHELVDGVRKVLEAAEIDVMDLDAKLGATSNADLLCSFQGRRRLIEVKSTSGNANEGLYDALVSHLREWPTLPGTTPIDGGALILNHEHRKDPKERSLNAYTRPEFLTAQTHPVVTTPFLLEAWRIQSWYEIQAALFGATNGIEGPQLTPELGEAPHPEGRSRWWGRQR